MLYFLIFGQWWLFQVSDHQMSFFEFEGDQLEMVTINQKHEETNMNDAAVTMSRWQTSCEWFCSQHKTLTPYMFVANLFQTTLSKPIQGQNKQTKNTCWTHTITWLFILDEWEVILYVHQLRLGCNGVKNVGVKYTPSWSPSFGLDPSSEIDFSN